MHHVFFETRFEFFILERRRKKSDEIVKNSDEIQKNSETFSWNSDEECGWRIKNRNASPKKIFFRAYKINNVSNPNNLLY